MAAYLTLSLRKEGKTHTHPDHFYHRVFVRVGRKWQEKGVTVAATAKAAAFWASRVYNEEIIGVKPAYGAERPMKTFTYRRKKEAA